MHNNPCTQNESVSLPMEYRLIRTLTCYLNEDESLAFDVHLENFDLSAFQKEFQVGSDNPMHECYLVRVTNLPFLKEYLPRNVGINWNFSKFSYYVEAVEN